MKHKYYAIFIKCIFPENPKTSLTGKILGGSDIDISENPWLVSINLAGIGHCGGFSISPNWIVTAAHCTANPGKLRQTVRAASNYASMGGEVKEISKIIIHPNYTSDRNTYNNDIALIKLTKPITSDRALPILLPSEQYIVRTASNIMVSGWGINLMNGKSERYPDTLLTVDVQVTDQDKCKSDYAGLGFTVGNNTFCSWADQKGPCFRDYGGPAVQHNMAVGIVSWSAGCVNKYSTVYVSVMKFIPWIKTETGV